ncbi:hypothetical protein KFU94_68400 [Chloroflexi bacterium TSY]|nr:hypothetical protein [Chloroflexi bacterium TSY]
MPAYQREALQLAECLLLALRYEQETLDQLQSLFCNIRISISLLLYLVLASF